MVQVLESLSCHPAGIAGLIFGLLVSAWSSTSCYMLLGSESADGRSASLSPFVCMCDSTFQIHR